MKVLIVSHNALGDGTNMGRTLGAWFQDFSPGELAQFYIRGQNAVGETLCGDAFRMTDGEVLRRLLGRSARETGGGAGAKAAYRYGRRRTALGYLLRGLLWRLAPREEILQWAQETAADAVFLAAGDHGFLYDLAVEMAGRLEKPLVVACVDDFYLYKRWKGQWLGPLARRCFGRSVKGAMARAGMICTICPAMAREYEGLFGKSCRVLPTPAGEREDAEENPQGDVVYLGNVSLKRREELVRMGRALKNLNLPGGTKLLQVYSKEQDAGMLAGLTEENGICFHGAVDDRKAREILRTALAAVHVESFDEGLFSRLRLSVSTKIPQILAQGPCLIAFGPKGIASMDYLSENDAAFVITDPEELEGGLRRILTDAALRRKIRERARSLAEKNHGPGVLRRYLEEML